MKAAISVSATEAQLHSSRGVSASSAALRLARTADSINDGLAVSALDQGRDLFKQRLARPLPGLFRSLTGLRLHQWWHQPVAGVPPDNLFQPCPRARQRFAGKLPARCEACRRNRWQPAGDSQETQRRFAGCCGSINYWACLRVLGLRVLTLLVQQPPPTSRADKSAFARAISLARLIAHDLEATLRADFTVKAESRPGLCQDGDDIPPTRPQGARGNHRQHLVDAMLNYIHTRYSHPMQLSDLAAALDLNPTYVSDLFSTTVGVTFHRYLEDLRLTKAKELLRNPRNRVCEVARAVGYTNPNHFRSVFRAHVGRPPSAWR